MESRYHFKNRMNLQSHTSDSSKNFGCSYKWKPEREVKIGKIMLILLVILLPEYANSQVKEFKFSNMPDAEITFTIRDSIMEISNIPKDEHYNYIRFERENKKVIDGNVSFRLPYEKSDRYRIFSECDDIWKILKKNTSCWGWELYFLVENDECFFEISPVYEINKLIYFQEKNPQDFLTVGSDNEEIAQKAKEITANCKNDYEKAKAIHGWIATNIYYDRDGLNNRGTIVYGALEVLQNKKTVCEGYANLTMAMLRSLQIPCRKVSGFALGVSTSGSWSIHNIDNGTKSSRNREFHPIPLTEPYVKVSPHTALIIRTR